MQREGAQGAQDGLWMEELVASGMDRAASAIGNDEWFGDLTSAWDKNSLNLMEEAIAKNMEILQQEKVLGMAQMMRQSLI